MIRFIDISGLMMLDICDCINILYIGCWRAYLFVFFSFFFFLFVFVFCR